MPPYLNDILAFISLLFFPLLYAETHYRFKYFFSWLSKAEPEIIADIPSRIEHGSPLPILVIVKDAHRYPVQLKQIEVVAKRKLIFSQIVNTYIERPLQEIVVWMETNPLPPQKTHLDIQITYEIKNRVRQCLNDNHKGTSHQPLEIYLSQKEMPRFPFCYYGEMHCHSSYTSDQVEFGPSLGTAVILAKAMGLDFYCATDHSYDLDDTPDNYLQNDATLPKWKSFLNEVNSVNKKTPDFVIIPGEEVSIRNKNDKNVHCLVYNSEKFFPGSGDGGEKWFLTYSEYSIPQLLKEVNSSALIFAAHPTENPPFLQRLFISRDMWHKEDCEAERLNGLQIINGGDLSSVQKGIKFWIDLLLRGNKLIAIAGNDAHGNFARFRQVGFPFFTMREHMLHLFGKWRTGVYLPEQKSSVSNLLSAIQNGMCFITNGPALRITVFYDNQWQMPTQSSPRPDKIKIEAISTEEYSFLESMHILAGDSSAGRETVFKVDTFQENVFEAVIQIDLPSENFFTYYRIELYTKTGFCAYSNPVWY